jgi:glycine cleavage system aminomethyltransferase T
MTSSELALKPQRLSPFYHKQASLGAKFIQDQFDWTRPERFSDPNDEKIKTERSIGIYDISHLIKLSVKGTKTLETVAALYNQPVSIGALLVNGPGLFKEAICAILSKDEAIFITNPSHSEAVTQQLNTRAGKYQTLDVSPVLGGLYWVGRGGRFCRS